MIVPALDADSTKDRAKLHTFYSLDAGVSLYHVCGRPAMLDQYTSDTPTIINSQLHVCPSNPPQEPHTVNILLIEPAMTPRSNREAILSAGAYCVMAVCDVRGVFLLRDKKLVAFAVINDMLGPFGLRATAECVPSAMASCKDPDSRACGPSFRRSSLR